jgi:hypothetical protein
MDESQLCSISVTFEHCPDCLEAISLEEIARRVHHPAGLCAFLECF